MCVRKEREFTCSSSIPVKLRNHKISRAHIFFFVMLFFRVFRRGYLIRIVGVDMKNRVQIYEKFVDKYIFQKQHFINQQSTPNYGSVCFLINIVVKVEIISVRIDVLYYVIGDYDINNCFFVSRIFFVI